MWDAYPLLAGEVGLQKTAMGWIDHVQEMFGFLGGGVPLVLAPPATRTNPVALLNLCRLHSVSRLVQWVHNLENMETRVAQNSFRFISCLRGVVFEICQTFSNSFVQLRCVSYIKTEK